MAREHCRAGPMLARAALRLVGARFRLHGRDAAAGLDCVGVVEAACAACGIAARLPNGYALRSRREWPGDAWAARLGMAAAEGPARAGDVIALRPGPLQFHLAIAVGDGRFVHAHAGLRRVVAGSLPPDWPLAGHWRFRERESWQP